MLSKQGFFFFPLYQYFSLSFLDCIWRFISQLCFYKQTIFSQTPLLPPSLFQDLIEKPGGWKNSRCLMCSHPLHRSLAPLAPLLLDLFPCFLCSWGLTHSLLQFLEVLFLCFSLNIQLTKQEAKGKYGCISKYHGSPTYLTPS